MVKRNRKQWIAVILAWFMMITPLFASISYAAKAEVESATEGTSQWRDNGIYDAYSNGKIRPNESVKRIDFAIIMNRIIGFQSEGSAVIRDIPDSAWYRKDAAVAVEAGYMTLHSAGKFMPNASLTRGEAALALDKIFHFSDTAKAPDTNFKDLKKTSPEMIKAINALVAKGYVEGYKDNTFKPDKSVTTADLFMMLDRIIGYLSIGTGELKPGTVKGNVIINRAGVTLKDAVIEGNLYLTEGIGQGDALLNNTTVKGKTYISGGGELSIGFLNSVLGNVDVNKKDDKVRVYVKGTSSVSNVTLKSGATIEETELTGEGFKQVTIPAGSSAISLIGAFDKVLTAQTSSDGGLRTISVTGTVEEMLIDSKVKVILSADAAVKKMIVAENGTDTTIEGAGKIETMDNRAANVLLNGKPLPPGISGPYPTPNPDPWTKVWSDEFEDGTIDPAKWTYDLTNGDSVGNPGWGNNELQYYTNRPENVQEQDGKLVITARKETYEGFGYTSSRIKTKGLFSKKYGKFEIRASAPTGKGYWPAIWMLPEDSVYGNWAASGEVDIMEGWGSKPQTVAGTLHYGSQWPNNTYTGKEYNFEDGTTIEDFHTYAIEWEPGEIRWYVDGKLYSTQNDWYSKTDGQATNYAYPAPFDQNFHLIMNLAVGGNFDGNPTSETVFPKSLVIDYVRVYELTGRSYREPVPPAYVKEPYLEGAKLPQADGNLVYNNNFTQNVTGDAGMGIPNTAHWAFYQDPGAAATVAIQQMDGSNYANVSITNAGGNVYSVQPQAIVSLAKGRFYKLTFDAKTDTARSMSVKVTGGASRGFAAYSQALSAALIGDVSSYEMSFQMKSGSDNAARIEFNMGTNTHPVWIGNVKLIEVESIPFEHDAPKTPQGDGNHVYNGTFDQGEPNRMSFWHIVNTGTAAAAGQVDAEERKLNVTISNGGSAPGDVKLLQKGVFLLGGHDYTLTFDAAPSAARDIQVELARKDGSTYEKKTATLTAAAGTYTVTFDNLTGSSDPESQLIFHLGGTAGTIKLDNIKLIRTSPYIPPNTVMYPLVNGDFSAGLSPWEAISDSGGFAAADIVDGAAKVTVGSQGSNPWSAMLIQNGLPVSAGIEYAVSFDARATVNRPLEMIAENGVYTRFIDKTVNLTSQAARYSFTFTMPNDDVVNLKFLLGLLKDTTAVGASHDVFIDNVLFEVKDAPVSRPPGLSKDVTNNTVGSDIDITFIDDAAWREKITAVTVNGTAIAAGDYTVAAGKLTVKASRFAAPDTYAIRVEADGYAPATVTQIVLPNDGNLVVNGSFANGSSNWSHYVHQDAGSTFTVENGAAKLAIGYKGNAPWHTQFYQEGIMLEAGKTYELSFKASSTQDRPITVEYSNTAIPAANFNLTGDGGIVHTNRFIVNAATVLKLNYLLGDVTNGAATTPATAHTITIDDVAIKEVQPGGGL